MQNILDLLEEKRVRLAAYQPLPLELVANLNEWFKIELTYTSNALEGNTLSRAETALVVQKGITVDGKTIQEHLEAINHAQAFDWVMQKINTTRREVTQNTILELHQLILQKIVDDQAGRYRTVPVRIAGSSVIMPNAAKVPELMETFIGWLQANTEYPATVAVDAHFKFVSIHPFVDGNGRTARLLMNLLLMQAGFPPAIIRKEDRKQYIASIEKAQRGGSLADHYTLMYAAIDRSLDFYLDTLEGKEQAKKLEQKPLLKIGELAKLVGASAPTIRHWTKAGLLHVAEYTKSGYQLYNQDQVAVVKKIRTLQNKDRLTIAEIKQALTRIS
ncbi:MAG: cell filamentation protein Fic [Candidatus Pacebacteria bacterium RIFCSPHIGHO2_01_FULL_46_16]|nr:MAG: cell filamentation protein Fic [Candidatus Pacebacteria bacterium RIFCSPHIGHO2_01_FULL_46_16]OGJ21248.1 MAG: cell filamentation protein Fic [Candidatus Pacebacteria bacterium RIFCSPHIGHO2_02_FULL_46_9]OGJ38764.1 MAG: cell filamentation protein Fic [Candidatus Pacebacteria bacterium RIFCSPLOWO2_01_FULL_47_12]